MMAPVQLKPGVWWVGAIDWNERNFHGYTTNRGSTYNAYLIVDEKITLIDGVKRGFEKELIGRISQIVDPSKIDYIISNHTEMDHSSGIPAVLKLAPQAKVVTAAPKGIEHFKAHFGDMAEFIGVKSGETLNIGKRTLSFIHTPMVHWPESMATYSDLDKIAFTMDAFGQHFASSMRFDDEVEMAEVMAQAKKYYANIVMPFAPQVVKVMDALAPFEIDMIAPSHGVVWRSYVNEIMKSYNKWSHNKLSEYAVVVYDSMWHSTEDMASQITDAFMELGVPARLFDLKVNHISDIITETLDARYVAVGSSTLNNNLMPTVASFLTYLKGLTPRNRHAIGIPFGSYGWSGQSVGQVAEALKECQLELAFGEYKQKWVPTEDDLNALREDLMNKVKELQAEKGCLPKLSKITQIEYEA